MLHRVIYGSIERFIGILTEQFAGAFPLWLAPVQVEVITVNEAFEDYAKQVAKDLEEKDIRVETDFRNEKLGYKIREAQLQKIPYMLVIGGSEVEANTVNVRSRKDGDLGEMDIDDVIVRLLKEISSKAF